VSGSLTVIGGHSSTQGLTGLVTVPSGFTGISPLITSLQYLLTADSGVVSAGGASFENLNVAGQSGTETATVGGFATGILEITNTSSVGATTAGSANISLSVPTGYNTLIVQAPGSETINGNGASLFAVFGAQSTVDFNSGGGNGTIFAGAPGDVINASGANWSIVGGASGGAIINASGTDAVVSTSGAGDMVQTTAQNASIQSGGSSDVINTSGSSANNHITVTGNATIENAGSADTVAAAGGGAFIGYFQGSAGGQLDFINSSTAASSVIASLNLASGAISSQGSVTISAGAGGGVYDGGISGNNSLVGGSGAVTLFSAGVNNYLYANGAPAGTAYNLLNAFSGGNDTLIAGNHSTNNLFFAGIGTESILSSGSGSQTYFVGTFGSETISASTVAGASNTFIFQQAASQGGGTDVLENAKPGEGYINLGNGVTGVTILSFEGLNGAHGGTEIDLSDGTTIKLFGVAVSSFSRSIIGGTHF
jgi:hypothetical protein